MVEGGQGSLVGLAPINRELYKDSHPSLAPSPQRVPPLLNSTKPIHKDNPFDFEDNSIAPVDDKKIIEWRYGRIKKFPTKEALGFVEDSETSQCVTVRFEQLSDWKEGRSYGVRYVTSKGIDSNVDAK